MYICLAIKFSLNPIASIYPFHFKRFHLMLFLHKDFFMTEVDNTEENYIKGRGAQLNIANRFLKQEYVQEHWEGIDEPDLINSERKTKIYYEHPKNIINKIESPDLYSMYSMNPYQGCEHGCIYCYARNSHQYYGFSAGLDFERNIIIKENAPELLEVALRKKNWQPTPIMLSGNTDCYQPLERKLKITRRMLEVLNKFRHPVGIITKNQLILRDIDILKELAADNLVHVMVSITTLNEDLRLKMEPRTASAKNRLKVVETLAKNNIPVGIMNAPIIPALNSMEIPEVIRQAGEAGADACGYTIVRLNGKIGEIFTDWIHKNFPDRAERVLKQIKECHGGNLNDSQFGRRMHGDGNIADIIHQLHTMAVKKYITNNKRFEYNTSAFKVPARVNDQLKLGL